MNRNSIYCSLTWLVMVSLVLIACSPIVYYPPESKVVVIQQPAQQQQQQQQQQQVIIISPPTAVPPTAESPRLPDPVQAVYYYWNTVSVGNYWEAWTLLTPSFQDRIHNNSYDNYLAGYRKMALCSITVSDAQLYSLDGFTAIVRAHLIYRTGSSCSRNDFNFDHYLTFKTSSGKWLIERVKNA